MRDGFLENSLEIQYKDPEPDNLDESDESDNLRLRNRSPRNMTPSEIHFTLVDKTTKNILKKRNVAGKSIVRKAKETLPTLPPHWNLIPDGTITNYSPHTITIDTPIRKNTVNKKNDLAVVTENKPRLILTVAWKTLGESKRNPEKLRKFSIAEERNRQASLAQQSAGNPSRSNWSH